MAIKKSKNKGGGIKSVRLNTGQRVQLGSKAYNKYTGAGSTAVSGTGKNLNKRDIGGVRSQFGDFEDEISTTAAKREANAAGELLPYQKAQSISTPPETPAIDTAIPSPTTVQATPYTQPNPRMQMTREGWSARVPTSSPSRYQAGFQAAQATGAPAPSTPAQGRSMVSSYTPPVSSPSPIDTMFSTDEEMGGDPFFQEMGIDFKDFFSPPKQKESLLSEYKRMYKNSGLEDLNEELINAKNVIEGTEEDVRDEITKAGGFGTESQIAAMTNARNKTLIKNYNKLVDLQTSQQQHFDTMMQLSQQDRQLASQEANNRFNMGIQLMQYRDSFLSKATEKANAVIQSFGGIKNFYNAYKDDPYAISKAENALGFGSGGLARAAATPLSEEAQLDLENKRLTNQKLRADINGGGSSDLKTQYVELPSGGKALINTQTGEIIKDFNGGDTGAEAKTSLTDKAALIDTILNNSYLKSAVGPTDISRFDVRSPFTQGKQNFIADVQRLASAETLSAITNLKKQGGTLGALNEKELEVLQSSATKLNSWATEYTSGADKGKIKGYKVKEDTFKAEIDRINQLTKKALLSAGATPYEIGAITYPDGSIYIKNSNGTFTRLN